MTQRKRAPLPLRAWLKWLPFFVVPYLAISAEAWLHVERIQNDYELGEMRAQLKELRADAGELADKVTELEQLERISAKAPDLGLVAPAPGQIVVVSVEAQSLQDAPLQPIELPVELAQADAGPLD